MQKYQSSKPFYPLFFLYVCTTKCTFLRRLLPLLRLSDLSNQQTHSNVSKNKDLSITNRNITYSYQLLRSMSKDSLIPEKNMSDSNRLKRRASIS